MSRKTVLFLTFLSLFAFSQSASDYCYSEKLQGETCYKSCCESLGYTYNGGCMVSDSEQAYVTSSCGYCTDSYMECVANYESGQTGGSTSSSGGCCGSIILILLVGVSAFIPRN
ncbi:MAG: hypothetical protein V1861_05995 [Candidatus Micrarchaeota archaeon]